MAFIPRFVNVCDVVRIYCGVALIRMGVICLWTGLDWLRTGILRRALLNTVVSLRVP